jgi:alanyl-tRNA synthetase
VLLDERRKLERELAEAKKALALGGGGAKAESADEEVGGIKFSGQVLDGLDPKELRGLLDTAKARMGSGVAAVVAVNDGKASIAAAVTDDLTGKVSAVELVKAGVEALGGKGGGGRPDMAQGGGPDGSKADEAIAAVRAVLAG